MGIENVIGSEGIRMLWAQQPFTSQLEAAMKQVMQQGISEGDQVEKIARTMGTSVTESVFILNRQGQSGGSSMA